MENVIRIIITPRERESQLPTQRNIAFDLLRSLSDLCTRLALVHSVPHAPILASSVRRHVINRIRPKAQLRYGRSDKHIKAYSMSCRLIAQFSHLVESFLLPNAPSLKFLCLLHIIHSVVTGADQRTEGYYMFKAIWSDMIAILRGHLFLFLTHARLPDCESQFFIHSSPMEIGILPNFIPPKAAKNILFAGNATKCILLLSEPDVPSWTFPTDADEDFLSDPTLATLHIESKAMAWRRAATQKLSEVFPFQKIRERITNLRRYLLHGEPCFWRIFFTLLRETPSSLSNSCINGPQAEEILNKILQATMKEHGTTSPPFVFKVKENGDVIPNFTLSFLESQVLASRAHIYCDLFSVTFSVRRAACELQATYLDLQIIRRRTSASHSSMKQILSRAWELRRRMACFIDSFEVYIQAQLLQPGFDFLLNYLTKKPSEGTESHNDLYFERVVRRHELILSKLFTCCFVGSKLIMARLHGITGTCLKLGECIRGISKVQCSSKVEHVDSELQSLSASITEIQTEFDNNFQLMLRMLTSIGEKHSSNVEIACLLQQITINYVSKVSSEPLESEDSCDD